MYDAGYTILIGKNIVNTTQNPLNEFSGCHAGIMVNFQSLAELPNHLHNAEKTQQTAQKLYEFFHKVVLVHHAEEEEELFDAVRNPVKADPVDIRNAIAQASALTQEHRHLESLWYQIEPAIKKLAKGKLANLDIDIVHELSSSYLAHAQFEENTFLPLAAKVLEGSGLAALGLSLHIRHHHSLPYAYI